MSAKRQRSDKMLFQTSSAELFKNVASALQKMIPEANFEFSERGITLSQMDPAHVCLVSLVLGPQAFDAYNCSEPTVFGVKIDELASAMKKVSKDDSLELRLIGGMSNKLRFKWQGQWKAWHDLVEMDLDELDLTIPETRYTTQIAMPSKRFKKLVKQLRVHADCVRIRANTKLVVWDAEGENGASMGVKMDVSTDGEVQVECECETTLRLSLIYLDKFTACAEIADRVYIQMAPDVPICVVFVLGREGVEEDVGQVRLYLAPKIDE